MSAKERVGVKDMATVVGSRNAAGAEPQEMIPLYDWHDLLTYIPPPDQVLVGEGLVEAGELTIIFGEPSTFKSWSLFDLGVCGARGSGRWLGFDIKAAFNTLWIHDENGKRRVATQAQRYQNLPPSIGEHFHISDKLDAIEMEDLKFCAALRKLIIEKQIRVLVIDNVSSCVEDEDQRNFSRLFKALGRMMHGIEPKPAIVLLHHARKPKTEDRGGRGLIHTLSGHQFLRRKARAVLFMQRAGGFDDKSIVAVVLKTSNSDEEGERRALEPKGGGLEEIEDFPWEEWEANNGGGNKRGGPGVTEAMIRQVFQNGVVWYRTQREAVQKLMEISKLGKSACAEYLKLQGGIYSKLLAIREEDGFLGLKVAE